MVDRTTNSYMHLGQSECSLGIRFQCCVIVYTHVALKNIFFQVKEAYGLSPGLTSLRFRVGSVPGVRGFGVGGLCV